MTPRERAATFFRGHEQRLGRLCGREEEIRLLAEAFRQAEQDALAELAAEAAPLVQWTPMVFDDDGRPLQ